jgi:alpha-glucosidase (family GH31 glycosyl hydrolase)
MIKQSVLCSWLVVGMSLSSCNCGTTETPTPVGVNRSTVLFTPEWVFEPWISKDISDGPDTEAFLAGFAERDIPVGVLVLDSPWETNYNTFIPNEVRYPNFSAMVTGLREDNIRLVLWTTQMVNESSLDLELGGDRYESYSPNLKPGLDGGFFVNDGAVSFWWKGYGAAVDFFNDDAVRWWRAEQNPLLQLGINGWKLDFGEQYITLPIITAQGEKSLQEYSEAYYQDFLAHGQATHPGGVEEFIIMARPYDESYGFEPRFYAKPEHATVAWVGDQDQSWAGINDALDHIYRSAAAGYAMLGSDIGGYLNTNLGQEIPFELEVFQRWTAMSGMMPLFQLHGRENLAPWTVDGDATEVAATVDAYRYWATLHHHMVPYWFSLVHGAQRGSTAVITPIGADIDAWRGDWRAWLGDAFLVAPMHAPGAARIVNLPINDNGEGYWDWWRLSQPLLAGGSEIAFVASSPRQTPVFVKQGAIVPMHVDNDVTGFGSAASAEALTVLAFPGPVATTFVHHERTTTTLGERTPTTLAVSQEAGVVRFETSRATQTMIVRLHLVGLLDATSSTATIAGSAVDVVDTRAAFDDATQAMWRDDGALWVKVPATVGAVVIEAR